MHIKSNVQCQTGYKKKKKSCCESIWGFRIENDTNITLPHKEKNSPLKVKTAPTFQIFKSHGKYQQIMQRLQNHEQPIVPIFAQNPALRSTNICTVTHGISCRNRELCRKIAVVILAVTPQVSVKGHNPPSGHGSYQSKAQRNTKLSNMIKKYENHSDYADVVLLYLHWLSNSTGQQPGSLESRRRRTKGSVVGEEWCQNAAPLR